MLKWMLWALLAVILLLFFIRTQIKILYVNETLTVKIRLLRMLVFTLYPLPPPKEKSPRAHEKKAKPEKPTPEKAKKKKAPIPIGDILQTINDILPLVGRSLDYWLGHIIVERLLVRAVIHEEEAADTAVKCGKINAAAYTLYGWFSSRLQIKEFRFNTVPNFLSEEQQLNMALHIAASPAAMLWGLVLFLARGGMALWRGPLFTQDMKKQPSADKKNRSKKRPATKDEQIKESVL